MPGKPDRPARRPYLLRALVDWIVDCGLTPHVLVDATVPGLEVPQEHVRDGRIVLNVSPAAVRGLEIGRDAVTCEGRFGGRARFLCLPMASVIAVYARETGEGMVFEAETFTEPAARPLTDGRAPDTEGESPDDGPGNGPRAPGTRGGHLKRVK